MIWYEDPYTFFSDMNNWYNIIPTSDMDFNTQLNALVIFAAYFCILVVIIQKDYRAIYVLVFVCFMTWLFHRHRQTENFKMNKVYDALNIEKDQLHSNYCVKPTKDNPFMNVTLDDYKEFPNRPPACENKEDEVKKLFKEGAPIDTGDVFGKKNGFRQFYTTPNTTIPNDVDSFKKYLFDLKPTLKQMHQNF